MFAGLAGLRRDLQGAIGKGHVFGQIEDLAVLVRLKPPGAPGLARISVLVVGIQENPGLLVSGIPAVLFVAFAGLGFGLRNGDDEPTVLAALNGHTLFVVVFKILVRLDRLRRAARLVFSDVEFLGLDLPIHLAVLDRLSGDERETVLAFREGGVAPALASANRFLVGSVGQRDLGRPVAGLGVGVFHDRPDRRVTVGRRIEALVFSIVDLDRDLRGTLVFLRVAPSFAADLYRAAQVHLGVLHFDSRFPNRRLARGRLKDRQLFGGH